MKTLRTLLFLFCGLLMFQPAYSYVLAPAPAKTETVSEAPVAAAALSKKELKAQKKEMRAQKRAERKARFWAWVAKKFGMDDASNDQLIAILLVLFLGGLGIHRIFLKSKPIIILWYFLTIGGFFGLIPLIDLIRFIMGDIDHYRENNSLFAAFQSA